MKATSNEVEAKRYCVKELADKLGHHASFVYAMRGAGFVMQWDAQLRCEAATVADAQLWIEKTGFRKK